MEEKGDILLDILKQMSIKNIKILLAKAGKDIKLNAKKEVIEFDNDEMFEHIKHLAVHNYNFYDNAHFIMQIIKNELNKRHLSTFDEKDNLKAEGKNGI